MDSFQVKLQNRIKLLKKSLSLTNEFKTLKTDEERVTFTFNVLKEFDLTPTVEEVPKNSQYSERLRETGNKFFLQGRLNGYRCITILKLYTSSIAYAPYDSKELPMAYANRSAILLKIRRYKECIEDIDRALSLNYPDALRAKLYIRKAECSVFMGESSIKKNYTSAMHWVENMSLDDLNRKTLKIKSQQLKASPSNLIKSNSKELKECKPTIISPNLEVPCASDAVAIKYNNDYGRHVIAVRDISPGEIISIEKPYSLMLVPDNVSTHCSNCLEVSWANIPCNNCTYAMYCSEKCKTEDWIKCHDIECSIFAALSAASSYPKLDLNSIRLTIQAIKEFNNIGDLRTELAKIDNHCDPRTKGFSSGNKYYSNKYRSVYALATNVEKRDPEDLFRRSVDACFITYLLATRTAMFGNKQEADLSVLAKNSDVTFIGGLILRHQQILPINMHTFYEEYGGDFKQRSIAMLPFCSLINHSCNPNIMRNSRSDTNVLTVIYPIKEGEQIFDNYGQHYAMTPKRERQRGLLKQYYFECNCTPCRENWPLYFNLPSYKITVESPQHRSIITSALQKFNTYVGLATLEDIFDKPYITEDLQKMIQVLYDLAPMPCEEMNSVIETFKRVHDLQSNRFDVPIMLM